MSFVVVLDSGHDSPLDIEGIEEQAAKLADNVAEEFWLNLANTAFQKYRAFTLEYLCHYIMILLSFQLRTRGRSFSAGWHLLLSECRNHS